MFYRRPKKHAATLIWSSTPLCMPLVGHTLACERNVPDVHVQLFPMFTPTGDYPNVILPDLKSRSANRLTHNISRLITIWGAKIGFEQVRRRAGLPKRKLYSPFDDHSFRPPTPILCAWSPGVLPPSKDWQSNVYVTGYFFGEYDSAYQPPVELQKFLKASEAPICVSFGSMMNRGAQKIDHIVRESLRQTTVELFFRDGVMWCSNHQI